MIAVEKWEWFGNAGHFICGRWCRFHLCTKVGNYLVSTVGEYIHPRHSSGSERGDSEYLKEHPLGEEIGCGRLFETFVFKAGKPCDAPECGCGLPEIDGSEIDSLSANTRKDARDNHIKLCRKFARRK